MISKLTKRTAILIDGGYYRARSADLWGKKSASDRAKEIHDYCMLHISEPSEPRDLYRIFYYDCPPMSRSIVHPLTGRTIDYSALPGNRWFKDFCRNLSEKSHVALRMGELAENNASFVLKDSALSDLLSGAKAFSSLIEDDFRIDVKQKGVDMRIGLDVASLSYGHLVDQIILIAGDSDFLPAAKMARKSGIDFILDPMKQRTKHNMVEHVDELECYTDIMYLTAPTTAPATVTATTPDTDPTSTSGTDPVATPAEE